MSIRSRKSLRDDLLKRSQESYDKKDDSGRFGNIFKTTDKRLKFWKCGEGEHTIDIIPWLSGDNYPTKNYPDVVKGELVYVLDVWVHRGIGPDENTIVCPSRNYGKPCPICEDINEKRKDESFSDDSIKDISPKRRSIYQIVCYDSSAEEEKGVQIWDVAHFFMEKHIAELAKKPRSGGFVLFADPDEGKQIYFKRKGTGQTNTEFVAHQFLDRDYTIADETLDEGISLDDYIEVLSYEELEKMYWGRRMPSRTETGDESPEPTSDRVDTKRRRIPKSEPTKKEEDSPPWHEDTKEEAPTRRPRKPPVNKEEPKEKSSSDTECPGGGTFGVDIEQLSHCGTCKVWDDCALKAEQLNK